MEAKLWKKILILFNKEKLEHRPHTSPISKRIIRNWKKKYLILNLRSFQKD